MVRGCKTIDCSLMKHIPLFVYLKRTMVFLLLVLQPCLCFSQYKVDRLLLSGRVAMHYEDYVLSIQYFNQAINQKPYLWEPWHLRAIAKYYLEDWIGAESDATKAIELNPYLTSLYDLRGIALIKQERYSDAIKDYTKAISLEPQNQGFWYNRAVCYMENKQYEEAQLQLDTVIVKWKNYAPSYLVKAELYLHQKDTVTAQQWLKKCLDIDSHNAEAWRMNAYLAMSKNKWAEAEKSFDKALHYKQKDVGCYINRALVRLKQNNLRGAMSDYDIAIEYSPNNFLAHYNRGLLRQQVGDYNRAIEDFDCVLSFEPGNIMALFNRATLLDRTGDLRGAIRDYSIVINKFPDFWTGLQYRAECYRKLGMIAKAERDEFRILKAQMNKHLGYQKRWSRSKLSAMRKLSDIDPEKYNQIVVEDEQDDDHEYKSEYRGKVQNRQVKEQYQPYLALTICNKVSGVTSYTPYDFDMDAYLESLKSMDELQDISLPVINGVGEGTGTSTFSIVDKVSDMIDRCKDDNLRWKLLLLRSIAFSSAQNYQDALKDIEIVLSVNPDNVVALWQKTVCSAMVAEYEQTISAKDIALYNSKVGDDFKVIRNLRKDNSMLYYNEGTFYARRKEYDKALLLLTKAIEIDEGLPYAYYNRALVYLQMQDMQKAQIDLGKAGELGMYNAYSLMKSNKK